MTSMGGFARMQNVGGMVPPGRRNPMSERERNLSKSPIPTTSETLLKSIGGDPGSRRWGEFVRKYRPMMEGYLGKRFPGVEAEDIIQETLAALSKVLRNYAYEPEEHGRFHCYLTKILEHKGADALRAKSRREGKDAAYARAHAEWGGLVAGAEDAGGADEEPVPVLAVKGEAPGASREEWEKAVMEIAVRELRGERKEDRLWQAFWRTALHGEKGEDVAESLGMSRDAVYKARERMEKRLAEIAAGLMERV